MSLISLLLFPSSSASSSSKEELDYIIRNFARLFQNIERVYIYPGSFILELKAFFFRYELIPTTLFWDKKLLLVASTNTLDETAEILFLYNPYFSVVFHLIGKEALRILQSHREHTVLFSFFKHSNIHCTYLMFTCCKELVSLNQWIYKKYLYKELNF